MNRILRFSFFFLIGLGFIVFCLEIYHDLFIKPPTSSSIITDEQYDPSLSRLTSIKGLTEYCDSLYGNTDVNPKDSEKYAGIISQAIRQKFYHGYSYYSLGNNTIGYILAPLITSDLKAIVLPDDILKQPMAACSQQSIIGMEVFKRKGFNVRKVGFFARGIGGHFCYEAFFNGKWHFFDPDMEPTFSIMVANHFPPISAIVKNDSLLRSLYANRYETFAEEVFPTYSYGPVNEFPAPRARIYQYITKCLSYSSWLLLLLLYWVLQRRIVYLKNRKLCAELPGTLTPALKA